MKHPTLQCIHPEPSVSLPLQPGIQTWAKTWIQGVVLQVWIEWQLPTGKWRGWHFLQSIATFCSDKEEVIHRQAKIMIWKYVKIGAPNNQPKHDWRLWSLIFLTYDIQQLWQLAGQNRPRARIRISLEITLFKFAAQLTGLQFSIYFPWWYLPSLEEKW